jgi:hypothetical protein
MRIEVSPSQTIDFVDVADIDLGCRIFEHHATDTFDALTSAPSARTYLLIVINIVDRESIDGYGAHVDLSCRVSQLTIARSGLTGCHDLP